MPRVIASVVFSVVLLGVGAAITSWLISMRSDPPRREFAVLPPLVDTAVIRGEGYVEQFVGYATARADRAADLAAEVAGTIVQRGDDIEAGAAVDKGQILIALDNRQYQTSLDRALALAAGEQARIDELELERANLKTLLATAEAELRVAADERGRVSDLFERDLAHKKEYDFAKLAYQQARRVVQAYQKDIALIDPRITYTKASKRAREADAALARLDIERCTIKAPFAGTIQDVHVDLGDRVGPGSPVVSIIDSSRVEIPIQLPGAARGRVAVGSRCTIDLERSTGPSWVGAVARIAPAADASTRTFAVYVEVDNANRRVPLVPGTFVRALVDGRHHEDALLIPRGAIRDHHVMVVTQGVARKRRIVVEGVQFDRARISGDVSEGDVIVLSHLDVLVDGSPVRANPVEPGDAPSVKAASAGGPAEGDSP